MICGFELDGYFMTWVCWRVLLVIYLVFGVCCLNVRVVCLAAGFALSVGLFGLGVGLTLLCGFWI